MFKSSTPGDRQFLLHELPLLMTELEIGLPQTWNTAVIHLYTFHSVLITLLAGPFCVSNMYKVSTCTHTLVTLNCIRCTSQPINVRRAFEACRSSIVRRTSVIMCVQIEQFHTVVKGLNRGPRNTMASIRNHYLLLCSSNFTRLAAPLGWVVKARGSTAAGFMTRYRSADKQDLFAEAKGKGHPAKLTAADLLQLQEIWGAGPFWATPSFASASLQVMRGFLALRASV